MFGAGVGDSLVGDRRARCTFGRILAGLPFIFSFVLTFMLMPGAVHAEGSRTLFPLGYFSDEGGVTSASRSQLRYGENADVFMGIIRARNFFYIYARPGEYILLGTSGNRNAMRLYGPPGPGQSLQDRFGVPGNETLPGTNLTLSGTNCSSTGGNITSRAIELAGPRNVSNNANLSGYVPCYYQVPGGGEGVYGVVMTTATNTNIERWDITVRDSAASVTDIAGRVFTYAFSGDTLAATNGTYATHYYITSDGYRYSQRMRGLSPFRYVLYSNPQGFLDVNGDPLYRNVRGQGHTLNTAASGSYFRPTGTGIQAQQPTYPMFFVDVVDPAVDTADGLQATLTALDIPLLPEHPVALEASFEHAYTGGTTTYVGQGGVFTIKTEHALSYQILLKFGSDPEYDDPAHPDNRVLTGIATNAPEGQQVFWDGLNNAGIPMPSGADYTFEATGRAGEVHFPFLDAEANLSGGPTVTRLNGQGAPNAIVYYDDRGYTTNGVSVGTPNGHICGPGHTSQPTPDHSLIGIDSNVQDGSNRYYRYWGAAPNTGNTGNDCASQGYYGDAKGMDLWALIRSEPPPGELSLQILNAADVTATVSVSESVAPGGTAVVVANFGNVGSVAAADTTYIIQLPPSLTGVSCTGANCSYNPANGLVTIAGLPTSLSPGQWTNGVVLEYTAPASGSIPVEVVITTSTAQPVFPAPQAPDTATGTTLVDSGGGTVADVLSQLSAPSVTAPGGTVNVTVTFRNLGLVSAADVVYAFTLPQDLTGVSCSSPATCNYDANTGAVAVSGLPGTLTAGQSATTTLSYTAPQSGTIPVTASIATSTPENDAGNNTASALTVVSTETVADVTASVAPPAEAVEGTTVNVPVIFRNLGPQAAAGVTYTVTLSGGLDDVACSSPVTCNYNSGTGALALTAGVPATLQNGQVVAFTVSYTAPPPATVTFSATVNTSTAESNTDNNAASAQTLIIPTTYTVTFESNSGSAVSPITGVEFDDTITAPADPTRVGYTFSGWYKESGLINLWDFDTDTVTASITLYAGWQLNTYALTYTAGANGSITGTSPQMVSHGGSGSAVTAVPNAGYHFVQWSDGLTTASRTDTNVTGNLSLTASFAINAYTLSYTAGANGTISGTSPQTVNHGSNGSAVTAVPSVGYHFVQWSDGSTDASRTDSNVTGDITVTASFAINAYTLSYTAGANGTLTGVSPQSVNHGSNGSTVTAVPSVGYHFVQWSDGSTDASRTDTNVTGDITVTASFAINTYTLSYTAGANGTITGVSPQSVNHGSNGSTVTAVPSVGYHFVQWSDGSTDASRTDSNVTGDITVTASFAINTYTLSYTAGANGTITGVSPQTVNHGSDGSTVTAVPDPSYRFVGWSDGVLTASRTDAGITANLTVTALFALDEFVLTYTAGANGSIAGTSPQIVNHGGNGGTVTAVPDVGYHFVQWSDGSTDASRTDTNVTGDLTVTASFAINEYTLSYTAGANGSISGTNPQTVVHGSDGSTVTAVPDGAGYHFVQWSDGLTAASRTDTNVTGDLSLTAIFAINEYTLSYSAGSNGTISGASPQTVDHGSSGTEVTAVPADGYRFFRWDDGASSESRIDSNVTGDISVVASFARVEDYTLALGDEQDFDRPDDSTLSHLRRIRGGVETNQDNPSSADYADFLECDGDACRFSAVRSGQYEFTFIDGEGEAHIIVFIVHPNVGFATAHQLASAGMTVRVRVVLDDLPVAEEVRVGYAVENGASIGSPQPADLLTRFPQELLFDVGPGGNVACFEAGHCYKDLTFAPTVSVGEILFALQESDGTLIGNYQQHVVELVPVDLMPLTADLTLLPGRTVTVGTPVTVEVTGLPAGNYAFDWSGSDNATGIGAETAAVAAPGTALPGNYLIRVIVRDMDHPNRAPITLQVWLRVIAAGNQGEVCGAGGCDDDGTGIPTDHQEAACGIGVDDPAGAIPYRIQVGSRSQNWDTVGLCLETLPGYGLRLGMVAFLSSPNYGTGIDGAAVRSYGNRGGQAINAIDYTHDHAGIPYDFEVMGLDTAGESVPIVVPLPRNLTIPAEAVWRKYHPVDGWTSFAVDARNTLHSAPRVGDRCPSPVSGIWNDNPGLVEGLDCVRLVIEDGGPNDMDRQANGVIADPGTLSAPVVQRIVITSSGGGAMSPLMLLAAGLLLLWRRRRAGKGKSLPAVALAALMASASSAGAEDGIRTPGWFVGGTAGIALGEEDSDDVTGGLFDHGINAPASVEDKNRLAGRVFGGYRFGDHLSLEAGYANLGRVTTEVAGNPVDLNDIPGVLPASGTGWELGLSGYLPIAERLDLYGRIGVWHWETRYHLRQTGQERRPKASGMDGLGGLGIRYWINARWQTGLSWDRYRVDSQNVDLLGLNVVYQFPSKRHTPAPEPEPAPVVAPLLPEPTPEPEPELEPIVAPSPEPVVEITPPSPPVEPPAPVAPPVMVVRFDFDSAVISAAASEVIDEAAAYLEANPEYDVQVTGHTDVLGGNDYNLRLSLRRARAVSAALVARGVSDERIAVSARGLHEPLFGNLDDDSRSMDRRVDIVPVPRTVGEQTGG